MIKRTDRLETLFLAEISSVLARYANRFSGLVTITGVKVAKSLETAVIYYSVLGTSADFAINEAALDGLKGEIVRALRDRVRIKRIPSFSFQYDDTAQKAAAVEKIFTRLEKENNDGDGGQKDGK